MKPRPPAWQVRSWLFGCPIPIRKPGKTELAPPEISDFALFATFVVFLHLPSRLFPLDCGDKANGRGTALAVPIPFRIRAIREIRSSAVPAVPFPIRKPGKTELAPPEISDFALFATFVVFLHLPSRLFPLDCGDKANGRGTALAVPIPFRIRAIREIRSSAVPAVPFPIQSGVALRLPPHSIYRQGEIDVFEMKRRGPVLT